MPHVITSLCLREGSCRVVCPVECIVPGSPEGQWPWYYIDPDTCIDCGACVAECPFGAIYPVDEVPSAFKAKGGEHLSMPTGAPGFSTPFDGIDYENQSIHLTSTRTLTPGERVDLTQAIQENKRFFKEGPGYRASM